MLIKAGAQCLRTSHLHRIPQFRKKTTPLSIWGAWFMVSGNRHDLSLHSWIEEIIIQLSLAGWLFELRWHAAETDRILFSINSKRPKRTVASMDKRKYLAFLCLFLFVLTIGAVAFHHHDDDSDHNDCPVCVTVSSITTAVLSFFIFAVYILTVLLEKPLVAPAYNCLTGDLPFARAPPA